ncbi:MAG: YkgJ family cysteine cluster protein [Gammaproteobacteria bacterium]|nr:YkgJ family cysteine cluster protein [Gammaproteobacteria bacterium]
MSDQVATHADGGSQPELLDLHARMNFRCHRAIACFNACCKRADVMLTPYDLLRLKARIGKPSDELLRRHTVPFQMERDGLPGVKLRTDDAGVCTFLGANGCRIYSDRPTVCRYYPLGQLSILPAATGIGRTCYSLQLEEHCKGHREARTQSVEQYLRSQETAGYDEMNQGWLQLMLRRRSMGPALGRPPTVTLQLYFMACFDSDRFRRFVLSDNFRDSYLVEESTYLALAEDDISLMLFGVRFMRQVLFGERTIEEREGAWERRVEGRRAVWKARREAEIVRRQREEDEKYRDC